MSNKNVTPVKWHLGETEKELAFAEFQHAMICLSEAYYRFVGKSLSLFAHDPSLNGYDNVILHTVQAASRPKSISEMRDFTNRSDVANIQYSVRKLVKAGLIEKVPRSAAKGTQYRVTKRGQEVVRAYTEYRKQLLACFPEDDRKLIDRLSNASNLMVLLTGLYDQASRQLSTRG